MRPQPRTLATVALALVVAQAALRAGAGDSTPPATAPASKAADPSGSAVARQALELRRLDAQVVVDQADAQKKALDFIGSSKAHAEAVANLQQCKGCHDNAQDSVRAYDAYGLRMTVTGPDAPWLGVSVGPADEVLRSQLKLPEGTGVVVTKVMPDGPAQKSDVREHDILVSVNRQPVPDGDALDAIVKAAKADAPPLTIKLLRDGQPIERQVAPSREPRPFLSAASNLLRIGSPYRIGVSVSEPDETLRRQLRLDDAGLVVTAVAESSPAAKQGVKVNDVLVSANGRAMKGGGDLPEVVRGAAESPVELELLRGGVRLKITVTPEKDEAAAVNQYLTTQLAESFPNQELTLIQPGLIQTNTIDLAALGWANANGHAQTQPAGSPTERLDQIVSQLDQLRAAVEALRAEVVKKDPASAPSQK
jgi:S1-C subfamily serine protease